MTTSDPLSRSLLEESPAEKESWVEWYSKVGFVPIFCLAIANAIYNAVEEQSSWEAPALWSVALAPQAVNLLISVQDTKGIDTITMIAAAAAVHCMFESGKAWDIAAAACFIPHVFTPNAIVSLSQGNIDILSARKFEGLALMLAGICIVVGSPAMSFNSAPEILTSSLSPNLGVFVAKFGFARLVAPFYEESKEADLSEISSECNSNV